MGATLDAQKESFLFTGDDSTVYCVLHALHRAILAALKKLKVAVAQRHGPKIVITESADVADDAMDTNAGDKDDQAADTEVVEADERQTKEEAETLMATVSGMAKVSPADDDDDDELVAIELIDDKTSEGKRNIKDRAWPERVRPHLYALEPAQQSQVLLFVNAIRKSVARREAFQIVFVASYPGVDPLAPPGFFDGRWTSRFIVWQFCQTYNKVRRLSVLKCRFKARRSYRPRQDRRVLRLRSRRRRARQAPVPGADYGGTWNICAH
jgi:hypothetical protein